MTKLVRFICLCLLLLSALCVKPWAVLAQGPLTTKPAQLVVAGARGDQLTRTLLIQSTEVITGLQIVAPDLVRGDGITVLPASAIQATLPEAQARVEGVLAVPLTFDLDSVPSGEFSGDLLIRYSGGSLTLPVTVKVKDPWPLPLAVLCLGVIVGGLLSIYRSQGRPRDELVVRLYRLQKQMEGDKQVAKPFHARIEAHLVDVERAMDAEQWKIAAQALSAAETLWDQWRKQREDWMKQLDYAQTLLQQLASLDPESAYIKALSRDVDQAIQDAPTLAGPSKLREVLQTLSHRLQAYARLLDELDEIERLQEALPEGQDAEEWKRKLKGWQQRLDALTPGDDTAYQALKTEVTTASAQLAELIAQREGAEEVLVPMREFAHERALALAGAPPETGRELAERKSYAAQVRLGLFMAASYIVAIVLLAGAGFGEMYVNRPTFGASPWGDYFGLLAWGFGAEATRAAVVDMLRRWGLSGPE